MKWRSPVGDDTGEFWPSGWFDATGYDVAYDLGYHTGADLNCNVPVWDTDRGSPVYAIGPGIVTYAGVGSGSWGNLIVIRHDNAGKKVWSRYGHVENMAVKKGDVVARGQQIATIGNAGGVFPYHLHFDIVKTDVLEAAPGHWPGSDEQKVLDNYVDPLVFLRESALEEGGNVTTNLLKNPSFEGEYPPIDSKGNRRVPLEWTYFQFGSNGEVHTERAFEPQFIDDGQAAFRLYTNYQTHECAGIRQAVTLEKGAVYKLMVRILARPRQENDGLTSSGWVSPWIGVDLSGGISPLAGTVMKQSWITAESAKFDEYRDFEMEFQAAQSAATVFLWSQSSQWPIFRTEVFFDNARLVKVSDGSSGADDTPGGTVTGDNAQAIDLINDAIDYLIDANSLLAASGEVVGPVTQMTHYVNASNGLKLRASANGTVIRTMPYDEEVMVKPGEVSAGGFSWVAVTTKTDSEWCAKTYLSPLPGT